MTKRATWFIICVTILSITIWWHSIPFLPEYAKSPLNYISQITANLTLVYMAVSLMMSMRLNMLEKLFGSLDKNYKFHIFVGSLSLLFMIFHPLTLAVNEFIKSPNNLLVATDEALFFFIPRDVLRANLGIFAMYTVLFAFTFMTFLKIPYHSWLNTHRMLGLAFMLGSAHAYLAPSEIIRSPFLTAWLSLWVFIGISAALYSIVLFRLLGPHYPYKITKLEDLGDILNISLTHKKHKIEFNPGQFLYIRFYNSKLGAELHPFSPSSSKYDEELRFSIKELGDYTAQLDDVLKQGEDAVVYGPYGGFGSHYISGIQPLVWIGGGIGITPFLSMLHAEKNNPTHKTILLYYSLNKPEEAVFDAEISNLVSQLPNVKYVKWIATQQGFLTGDQLIKDFQELSNQPDLDQVHQPKFMICGPPPMMHALSAQLLLKNISQDNIIFEEFSFLS